MSEKDIILASISAPMVGVGGWKKVAPGPDGNLEKALLEAVKTQLVLAFIASESREFGSYIGDFLGTIIAGTVNIGVAWWLLTSITNICQDDLLAPDNPWTCPGDRVFFDALVIWGLVGPKRIFGSEGNYSSMNWFFLGGALGPILVWVLHKAYPKQSWIPLINLPVLLGATGAMPPATPLNYNAWIIIGTIFNLLCFPLSKKLVAKVQLHSFSSFRCWSSFHGGGALFLTEHGEQGSRLVGYEW
ncbi:hypothetical protein OROHE_018999 [Orobanche hederae]